MTTPLTIWCNAAFLRDRLEAMAAQLAPHRLVFSEILQGSNLAAGEPCPKLAAADAAFGQPDVRQVIDHPRIKWVHLTSAGYTKYDTQVFKEAMRARGGIFTTSSSVYDEPCAQHVLAMMLGLSRQLPDSLRDQDGARAWPTAPLRARSHLLLGQVVSLYGFGAIARRLVEMLKPFKMTLRAARRTPHPYPGVMMLTPKELDAYLGKADHIINVLPSNPDADDYFNADRLGKLKSSAIYYSIGRGSTTDQYALRTALETNKISAAYLDVATPEPLPPDDPLWKIPTCYITPHTAGGHVDEFDRLIRHFVDNLRRLEKGEAMRDRVV